MLQIGLIDMSIKIFIFLLLIFSLLACDDRKHLAQNDAEILARAAVMRYAENEKISFGNIKLSKVRQTYYDKDVSSWVIYYETGLESARRISVLVDDYRNTELHIEYLTKK